MFPMCIRVRVSVRCVWCCLRALRQQGWPRDHVDWPCLYLDYLSGSHRGGPTHVLMRSLPLCDALVRGLLPETLNSLRLLTQSGWIW